MACWVEAVKYLLPDIAAAELTGPLLLDSVKSMKITSRGLKVSQSGEGWRAGEEAFYKRTPGLILKETCTPNRHEPRTDFKPDEARSEDTGAL